MKRKIFIALMSVLCMMPLFSQPYCDVRQFNIRDGLAANIISGIAQTRDELMWFATWNGLCCYDGYRFTTFRDRMRGDEVLTTNRIRNIEANDNGDLWCCTFDSRLYLFDTRKNKYINVSKIIKDKLNIDFKVRRVYPLGNGYSWAASDKKDGLNFRINNKLVANGEGIELYSKTARKHLKDYTINKVLLDDDGREWVFTKRGVNLIGGEFNSNVRFEYMRQVGKCVLFTSVDGRMGMYDTVRKSFRMLNVPSDVKKFSCMIAIHDIIYAGSNAGIICYNTTTHRIGRISVQHPASPSSEVKYMFADNRDRIWTLTGSTGVMLINPRDNTKQWLNTDSNGIDFHTGSTMPFIYEDHNNTVWIVPNGGTFSYYDEAAGKLHPYKLQSEGFDYANLPNLDMYFLDKQGNMWFTCTHDLMLANFKYRHFGIISIEQNKEVRALFCDSKGRLWVGNSHGVVAVFNPDNSLLGYINSSGKLQKSFTYMADKIYSIYEDKSHRVWIGTKGMGLYMIDNGQFYHFEKNETDKNSLASNDIYDIHEDTHGNIWIATHGQGLQLLANGGKTGFKFIKPAGYPVATCPKVRRIECTHDGIVLLSTTGGLITFRDNFRNPSTIKFHHFTHVQNDTTSLLSGDVMQTCLTHDGRVFVATLSGGIQYTSTKELLKDNILFKDVEGFSNDEGIVQSMLEDHNHRLWIVREANIDEYNLDSRKFSQYGPNYLGNKVEFSEARPAFNPHTNRISLGGMGGVITFLPQKLGKSNYKPNIVFTSVQFQGDAQPQPILSSCQLELPADKRNVTISFAALDYSNNYLIRYAYMIEGKDKDWTYLQATHSASFNQLPAGHYRLLVKSTNADGVWMDNVKALNIYAHPEFSETIWAKFLIMIFVTAIACAVMYIYNLRKNASLEKRMSEMKTQFFTDLGHKLRTPLTLIGGPVTELLEMDGISEFAKKHLNMIQRNSRNMLKLVNKMLDYDSSRNFFVDDENAPVFANTVKSKEVRSHKGSLKLLVVEDNDDLRAFLVGILHKDYNVIEACNGSEGLAKAESEMPDFIITDVMMPIMDGLVMVHQIKQNNDICHIPIIVLSAKASLDDRLQGLREGVDDYITKPFSADYLKLRVDNIIAQRRMLQQNYLEHLPHNAEEENKMKYELDAPQIVDADNDMMQHLMAYLDENISNPNIKIDDMAEAVNLGRTVFYGKIKSIVGMRPVDFLRHVRIQRAEQLIVNSAYPLSQIAYEVGFGDSKYFSTTFKKEIGMTPSEYRKTKLHI
jgi:DNA-binding response OmpR family regulator/ligand-binding sensor domain-containing protein